MNTSCFLFWNLKCNSLPGVKLQSSVFASTFTRRTQLWTWELEHQCQDWQPNFWVLLAPVQWQKKDVLIHLHCSDFTVDSIGSNHRIISFIFRANISLHHSILYIQRTINAYSHSSLIKYDLITILFLTFSRLLTRWLLSGLFLLLSLSLLFFISAPVRQFYRTAIISISTVAALLLLKMLQLRAIFLIIHQSHA